MYAEWMGALIVILWVATIIGAVALGITIGKTVGSGDRRINE